MRNMINKISLSIILLFTMNGLCAQSSIVDSLYSRMSLEEKIGQILMPRVSSEYMPTDASATKKWQLAIDSVHVGGFIVHKGDVSEQRQMANRLQNRSRFPLLLGADFENGTGSRYDHGTHFVTAMGIGATGHPVNAYEAGKITALEAGALGVHLIFAPVADVNTNPDNIIINYRSFGDDPLQVSRFVTSFIKGVQENGAIAVAKHFPGHGDVNKDSHLELVIQEKSVEQWESEELPPFKAAIEAGVGGIMSAHIAFPAMTGKRDVSTTMSKSVLTGLLREKLNFKGLIITDALNMGGIVNNYWAGEAALRAFLAGADILLMPMNLQATARYLVQAAESGVISKERLAYSVKKIIKIKQDLNLLKNPLPEKEIWKTVGLTRNHDLADSISAKSLTLVRNKSFDLPLRPNDKTEVVVFSNEDGGKNVLENFVKAMKHKLSEVNFSAIDKRTTDDEYDEIEDLLDEAQKIIFAVKVPIASFSGFSALKEKQQDYFDELLDDYPKALVIVFGNPYFLRSIPTVENALLIYTYSETMQSVTAASLNGDFAISGTLPIEMQGIEPSGTGNHIEKSDQQLGLKNMDFPLIDKLVEQAIADSVFPGCQVAIGKNGDLLLHQAYGFRTYDKEIFVTKNDLYDLASLTKVLATTLALMKLSDRAELNIDYTLDQFFPDISSDKAKITLKQLLTHSSGFEKWHHFYEKHQNENSILNAILTDSLVAEPGTAHLYSDLNFILLRHIVEMLSGEKIETYISENYYKPMGLRAITYKPEDPLKCIPSEVLDGDTIQGIVQDRNARTMNGISGHAGLFSNTNDIAVIAQMLLNGGIYGGRRYLKKETIDLFREKQFTDPEWTHALGWDTPSPEGSLVGDEFPRTSIGHWGYSGTSLWLDFEDDIFVILLSNRTWPDRNNRKISHFRPVFHDTVYELLEEK